MQSSNRVTLYRGAPLSRAFIPPLVLSAVVFWPEEFGASAVPIACVYATLVVVFFSARFCRVFVHSFAASTLVAYAVYAVTAPVGDFSVPSQTAGAASDSQFFLFEARRFVFDGSIDALFSTWGSLVPVFFGGLSLLSLSGNYIGVVFFNSLLYSGAVILSSRIFNLSDRAVRFLPVFGWMPLQAFYNSMISKEPIYLFLIILTLHSIATNNQDDRVRWYQWSIFASSLAVCMLLRPPAAIVLALISIGYIFVKSGIRSLIYLILILVCLSGAVFTAANYVGYSLPIFFDSQGLDLQRVFIETVAEDKLNGSQFIWMLTPPWSVFLSPVLGVLWLFSPLPLLGNLSEGFYSIWTGATTFRTLAIFVRYADAFIMLGLLAFVFLRRSRLESVLFNPLTMSAILLVIGTVMFQFLESGRHRYFPGFVLLLICLSVCNYRKIYR